MARQVRQNAETLEPLMESITVRHPLVGPNRCIPISPITKSPGSLQVK